MMTHRVARLPTRKPTEGRILNHSILGLARSRSRAEPGYTPADSTMHDSHDTKYYTTQRQKSNEELVETAGNNADARPTDCDCWSTDQDLPCWPCYSAGFRVPNPDADAGDNDTDNSENDATNTDTDDVPLKDNGTIDLTALADEIDAYDTDVNTVTQPSGGDRR